MATTLQPTTPEDHWRLHYFVGDLAHYTAWTADFASVETLYEQYRRDDTCNDVTLERREVWRDE
jgi:hypothetical protein